jgi:hypothetical protein
MILQSLKVVKNEIIWRRYKWSYFSNAERKQQIMYCITLHTSKQESLLFLHDEKFILHLILRGF